jgi:hypothetical protein
MAVLGSIYGSLGCLATVLGVFGSSWEFLWEFSEHFFASAIVFLTYFLELSPSLHPLAWCLSCQVVSALRSYSFMGIYFVVSHFFSNFAAVIIL